MKNNWTYGHYGLYRGIFGLYLLIHFLQLLPWSPELFSNAGILKEKDLSPLLHLFPNILSLNDSPLFTTALTLTGVIGSVSFLLGKGDRIAAVWIWYLLACFLGRNPLIANPSLPFIGWLLLAHVFLPKPTLTWSMPGSPFLSAWIVMSLAYSYSGILKLWSPSWVDGSAFSYLLQNPLIRCNFLRDLFMSAPASLLKVLTWGALSLEILFAPLALFRRLRPWIWCLMLSMHFGLLALVNFADLTWGMIIVHFFTFDPGWIRPRPMKSKLLIYYDGNCGFCHSFVRFVLSENSLGLPFRFAPLPNRLGSAPDSIAVQTETGEMLYKSKAVFRVLSHLGGIWKLLAFFLSIIPYPFTDWIYDLIAKIRHRIFAKPKETCPIIPVQLREFFET